MPLRYVQLALEAWKDIYDGNYRYYEIDMKPYSNLKDFINSFNTYDVSEIIGKPHWNARIATLDQLREAIIADDADVIM